MLAQLEALDRGVWQGHSHVLEDVAHTLGGLGLHLLVFPRMARQPRAVGYALIGLSALLHLYAYLTPGSSAGLAGRLTIARSG